MSQYYIYAPEPKPKTERLLTSLAFCGLLFLAAAASNRKKKRG